MLQIGLCERAARCHGGILAPTGFAVKHEQLALLGTFSEQFPTLNVDSAGLLLELHRVTLLCHSSH